MTQRHYFDPSESLGYKRSDPPPNYAKAVTGAVGGGALGVLVWILLWYSPLDWLSAATVGVIAGVGAMVASGRRSAGIGVIVVASGVVGLFAGHYAIFRVDLRTRGEQTLALEAAEASLQRDAGAEGMSEPGRRSFIAQRTAEMAGSHAALYLGYARHEVGLLMYGVIFGGGGLIIGYRIAAGRAEY